MIRTSLQKSLNEAISKLPEKLERTWQRLPKSTSKMVMRNRRKVVALVRSTEKPGALSLALKKEFKHIRKKNWIVKD